jgi:hypothetical protein
MRNYACIAARNCGKVSRNHFAAKRSLMFSNRMI